MPSLQSFFFYSFVFLAIVIFISCDSKFDRPDLKACNAKNVESCSEWASLEYLDGNTSRAKELLEMACKNDDATSCYDLAMMLADEDQDGRSNELIIRACNLKSEEACDYVDDMNLIPGREKKKIDDLDIPTQKKEEENPNLKKRSS